MQATLMYGLGATRAGTTWLYRYLYGHPDCVMPTPKETHYFDALEFGYEQRRVGKAMNLASELAVGLDELPKWKQDRRHREIASLEAFVDLHRNLSDDPQDYLDYMTARAGSAELVGDITPAYALLPEARLQQMVKLAPETRFVYLLRDPLDRLWSNLRQMAKLDGVPVAEAESHASELGQQLLSGGAAAAAARSDYASVIERMRRAIPARQLFIGFYENLFSQVMLDRLCHFLGIAPHPGDFARRVNDAPTVALNPALKQDLLRFLAPQYASIADRMGDLPQRWSQNMMKV